MLCIFSGGHSGTSTVVRALLAWLAVAAASQAETARAGLFISLNCSFQRASIDALPTTVDESCATRYAGLSDDRTLDRDASSESSDNDRRFVALLAGIARGDGTSAPVRLHGPSLSTCALISLLANACDRNTDCNYRIWQKSFVHPPKPAELRLLDPPRCTGGISATCS